MPKSKHLPSKKKKVDEEDIHFHIFKVFLEHTENTKRIHSV